MHPSAEIKSNTDYICSIKPAWISCHGFNYISAESSLKYSLLFVSRLSVSHFPLYPKNRFALCLRRRRLLLGVSTSLSLDFIHEHWSLCPPADSLSFLIRCRTPQRRQSCASVSDWWWMQLTCLPLANYWSATKCWKQNKAVSTWMGKPLWFTGLLIILFLVSANDNDLK